MYIAYMYVLYVVKSQRNIVYLIYVEDYIDSPVTLSTLLKFTLTTFIKLVIVLVAMDG